MENDYLFSFFQTIVKSSNGMGNGRWPLLSVNYFPDSQVQINQILIAKLELKFASYVPFNKSRAIFVLDTF